MEKTFYERRANRPDMKELTWQAKFEEFDKLNPHVYERYKSLALEYIGANNFRISSKDIISVIRWHTDIQTVDGAKKQSQRFKINDAFTSRYVRKFLEEFPQHKNRFCLKGIRSL